MGHDFFVATRMNPNHKEMMTINVDMYGTHKNKFNSVPYGMQIDRVIIDAIY